MLLAAPCLRSAAAGLILALLMLGAGRAAAQSPPGLSIRQNGELRFGPLVAGPSAGAVTVTPAGTRWASGGALLGGGADVAAASFTVTGEPHLVYVVTLPATATLASGGSEMSLHSFVSGLVGSGALDGTGHQTFTIGATLEIGPGQPSGSYSGSFVVQVNYN